MARLHEGACTCPACCPDKWAANKAARQQMQSTGGGMWTGYGPPPPSFQEQQFANIMDRLERIEAILSAHIRPAVGKEPPR